MRTQDILFPNFFFDPALRTLPTASRADSLVEENEEGYFLQLDLPGVRKEDVKVTTEQRRLTIEAERKGRSAAQIRRVFTLPEDVNLEGVAAQLKDGVLELALPKQAAARAKQITVEEGKESFFSKLLGGTAQSA